MTLVVSQDEHRSGVVVTLRFSHTTPGHICKLTQNHHTNNNNYNKTQKSSFPSSFLQLP
ncbi:hypothetical protein HanPSC8_Chr15g0644181 [Helianthus annuus]|nr:hypothetical protein HanPSC8_Chr15g0644181 [Helianthus annuus]